MSLQSFLSSPTVYFGYGSNLWLHQMRIRCPTSTYLGIARLSNYTWLINSRGYANVVEVSPSSNSTSNDDISYNNGLPAQTEEEDFSSVVYGLVYSLHSSDERRLDRNEGVPVAYTKEWLPCDFWAINDTSMSATPIDTSLPPTTTGQSMLVYIDRTRTKPDEPKEEYVYRMNQGIKDALAQGVPEKYVERVMRKFIPADGEEVGRVESQEVRRRVEEKAIKQASEFTDESGVS